MTMKPKKFSLVKISRQLKKYWMPTDVQIIDKFVIRIAKFDGEYHWHKHAKEDELFIVIKGKIKIKTKIGDIVLNENEGIKIPKGLEHCPVASKPSVVLMFESLNLKSKGN